MSAGITNINVDNSGAVTATINGQNQSVDPTFLLMQILANKRSGLTAQYVNQLNDMNDTNNKSDMYREFLAKVRAAKPAKDDGKLTTQEFLDKVLNPMRQKYPEFDNNTFPYDDYRSRGNYDWKNDTGDWTSREWDTPKLSDMIEDIRNKVTSLNNLNSQKQVKLKMTEQFRDETIEWYSTLTDKLGRVFEKINS